MSSDDDCLAMTPEEMRRAGYATVDALVELLVDHRDRPVLAQADPAQMRQRLGGPAPEEGGSYDSALLALLSHVATFRSNIQHPGYFAFIPGSGTWPGALGDLMASALNLDCGNWMESSGPSGVELQVLDWFREWIGYPEGSGGILVSGGSAANMTALACARELRVGPMTDRAIVYCSDQSHSSVARAARTLGFRPEQLRVLPTDERYRLRVDALSGAVESDRRAGLRPLLVSANAGATNTGVVDPLPELADYCADQGIWLHVDAAYGGFAVLTEQGRELMRGLERADSVTLDPHKWLYQPFECGALLVRQPNALEQAFSVSPDYLLDTAAGERDVNFAARGMQLTRGSRALKVWLSLQTFGVAAFREAIRRSLGLAVLAQRIVEDDERLELMMAATLGVVCFRRRFPGVESEAEIALRNASLLSSLAESGLGMVSSTRLRGRYAIRLCVLNHGSTETDVRRVLEHLAAAPSEALSDVRALNPERVPTRPLQPTGSGVVDVQRHPLMAGLSGAGCQAVVSQGREVRLTAEAVVVRRWAAEQHFFLVLHGDLDVDVDGSLVRRLGAGDFFGELAARDWGSGYSYPRLASVTTRSDVLLWELPNEVFRRLMATEPAFQDAVNAAVRQRLPLS